MDVVIDDDDDVVVVAVVVDVGIADTSTDYAAFMACIGGGRRRQSSIRAEPQRIQ
jgi:hypothetical protein